MRLTILCLLLAGFTACTKDANRDIENPGISFLYGANSKNDFTLRPSSSPQKVTNLLVANLRAANPAGSDIHVTIADNTTALVNAYNTANGTAVLPLPTALWSMPSELVIKKGEQYAYGEITVSNTTSLDFSKQYAIGVSISRVSNGEKLADKLNNVFIVFRVQNAMDGRYNAVGETYHPGFANRFVRHNLNIELHTSGSNSVRIFWPITGYTTPFFDSTGAILNIFNALETSLQRNLPTNNIDCYNTQIGGIVAYTNLRLRGTDLYNSRWDSAGGKFYVAWGYNFGTGASFVAGTSRVWIDTLTYLGPR